MAKLITLDDKRCSSRRVLSTVRKMAALIKRDFNAKEVVLFGSYAHGSAGTDSDVDLFVIVETKLRHTQIASAIGLRLYSQFGSPFPIDIMVRTPKQVAERISIGDSFVTDIINSGIRL